MATVGMKHNTTDFVLGAEAFAAITAVEGLKLSAESKKRLTNLKASGISNDERRAQILRAYKAA